MIFSENYDILIKNMRRQFNEAELYMDIAYRKFCRKECEKWLNSVLGKSADITDDIAEMYLKWFNDVLASKKQELLKMIFNFDVKAEKISICNLKRNKNVKLTWEPLGSRYSARGNHIQFPVLEEYTRADILRMNSYICWNLLMDGLTAPLLTPRRGRRRFGEPVYLPASRTGFMLTYSQLLSNSLQTSFSVYSDESEGGLTQPYIDFLQLITLLDSKKTVKNQKINRITSFIEQNMTRGAFSIQKDFVPVIKYIPEGSQTELPLYVTSSVVSEISPILLILKSDIKFNTIIIEEPEAHLHPVLQKKMAQVVIQLMNSGVPVWITTHSDTILQHINNMLKLNALPDKQDLMEKYHYTESDLLQSDHVCMYQFNSENHNTTITPLEKTQYGFVVPTFNNALQALVDEVYAFQEEETDTEEME